MQRYEFAVVHRNIIEIINTTITYLYRINKWNNREYSVKDTKW